MFGIGSENFVLPAVKKFVSVKLFNSSGNEPSKSLKSSCTTFSFVKSPILVEIVAENWFELKSITSKLLRS